MNRPTWLSISLIALCASILTDTSDAQNRSVPIFDQATVRDTGIGAPGTQQPVSPDWFSSLTAPRTAAVGAASDVVYCTTTQLLELWTGEEWDPFNLSETTCNELGLWAVRTFQTHLFDEWELSSRSQYTYDQAGNLTEHLYQVANPEGTGYDTVWRVQHEFNESNDETLELRQEWDGSMWVNDERHVTTYDDQVVEALEQEWDGAAWVNVERETGNPQDSTQTTETWDGSMWLPDEQEKFGVEGDVFIVTNLTWDGTEWMNDLRYSQSPDFRRVESWDGAMWVGVQNQLLTRDGFGNIVELLEQMWEGGDWVNDYRATYVFDPSGSFQTEFQLDQWEDSQWKDDHRQLSTLDLNGNEIEELWQDWDDATSQWEDLQRYIRTFEAINVAIEAGPQFAGFSLSQNYPNPVHSRATIRFELAHAADASITLYDVLGRTVKTLHAGATAPGPQDLEVYVGGLANGMYYYRLRSGDVVLTRQMMVVK